MAQSRTHPERPGHPDVFAVGDVAAADLKGAGRASRQAEVVVTNIGAVGQGSELKDYAPPPPAIVIPLGPAGGASELPGQDEIAGAEQTAAIRGSHLFIERYRRVNRPRTTRHGLIQISTWDALACGSRARGRSRSSAHPRGDESRKALRDVDRADADESRSGRESFDHQLRPLVVEGYRLRPFSSTLLCSPSSG